MVAQVAWSATGSPIVSLARMKLLNFATTPHLRSPHQSAGDDLDHHYDDYDLDHHNYGLNYGYDVSDEKTKLTIETCVRGRKIELADFPEELEGGVEEMVVRFVFSLDLSFQFFFCFLEFN